jgi:hypothetical protein
MDHFNAMFEDQSTKSWWMQSTGEAVVGPLRGEALPEIQSLQMTANKFFSLYPFGVLMQPDTTSNDNYDSLARFEKGKSRGKLTKRDSLSWKEKSWVIGVQDHGISKAYDWNKLTETRIINDKIGSTPIVIALSGDGQSFGVFQRSSDAEIFSIRNDTLITDQQSYDFFGRNIQSTSARLKRINAYQEFWHSWRTFHPETEVHK